MVQFRRNICTKIFLIYCLVGLSIVVSQTAFAEYRKPKNSNNNTPKAESTNIAGIRGADSCSPDTSISLTTLAPQNHTGQTVSTAPTFAWYVPQQNTSSLRFIIYEYDSKNYKNLGKKLLEIPMITSSGIMTYSLPANNSWLTVGKKYIWEVEVLCNPFAPSQTLIINSEILVVPKPDGIMNKIKNTSDRVAKANIYAEAGLWYDALAAVANQPKDPQAQAFTIQLLEQLAEIEIQNNPQPEVIEIQQQKGQQLEKIAEVLSTNNKN